MIVIATEGSSPPPARNTDPRPYEEDVVAVKSFPSKTQKWGEVAQINKVGAPSKDAESGPLERYSNGSTATSKQNRDFDESESLVETLEPVIQVSASVSTEPVPQTSASSVESEATLELSKSPITELPEAQESSSAVAEPDLQNASSTSEKSLPESVDGAQPQEVPVRKVRKWKRNEVVQLIKVRSSFETEARKGHTKKSLWKSISQTLEDFGFQRTPEQCSSMWASLVKKHKIINEEIRSGLVSDKEWTYFDAMQQAEALQIDQKIPENSPDTQELAAT